MFKKGHKEGKGTLTLATGDRTEGVFHRGRLTGQGQMVTAGGNVMSGVWDDGVLRGRGGECVDIRLS